MTRSKGFTLVELMVVLAVAAVLISIAMPSLQSISDSNALKATTRDLISAINTARSQSISTRSDVTVQPATGGWGDGWSIVYDNAAAETNQDYVPRDGVTVAREGATGTLTFLSRGGLQGGAASFSLCHQDLVQGRTVSVSFLGKVTTDLKGDC